jgi:hypothetical protein
MVFFLFPFFSFSILFVDSPPLRQGLFNYDAPHCHWSCFFCHFFFKFGGGNISVAIMRFTVDCLHPPSFFLLPFFFKLGGGNIRNHYAPRCRWSFPPPPFLRPPPPRFYVFYTTLKELCIYFYIFILHNSKGGVLLNTSGKTCTPYTMGVC